MNGLIFAAERMGQCSLLWGDMFDPFLNEYSGATWIDVVARSYCFCSEPADSTFPAWLSDYLRDD